MEGPLVLDFQDVDMATSSFMDELFGKLYQKYESEYHIRLRAVNLNPILLSVANAVIVGYIKQLNI
jgi:hypothetical protein